MEIEELRRKYYNLNKSFKKKLVFHLGCEAGFFSEYNNMILAMLYCLTNRIQFVLYSEDANFGYRHGWRDYFLPFCDEVTDSFHQKYNFRDHEFLQKKLGRKDKLAIKIHKLFNGIDFLTQDLWLPIRDRRHEKETYNIPELDIINCSLRDACRKLIAMTWLYNPEIKSEVKNEIQRLRLPNKYVGLHIRRGDKHIEHNSTGIETYFAKMKGLDVKDIFVSTDDYNVILDIKRLNPDLYLSYLCKESQVGYNHNQYKTLDKLDIKEAQIELFASIDILSSSQYFIGTYSSNIGMYLAMRMNPERCMSVDINWQIW